MKIKKFKIPKVLDYYLRRHCFKCSKRLVMKKRWFYDYSNNTGEKEYMYLIGCPNDNWFNNIIPWAFHQRYELLVSAPYNFGKLKNNQTVLERGRY